MLKNRSSEFPTRSDTNRAVQQQKMARGLQFRIYEVEGLYYPYSKNKGPDQLRGYREADLRLCFRIFKKTVSHSETQLKERTDKHHHYSYKETQKHVCSIFHVCNVLRLGIALWTLNIVLTKNLKKQEVKDEELYRSRRYRR